MYTYIYMYVAILHSVKHAPCNATTPSLQQHTNTSTHRPSNCTAQQQHRHCTSNLTTQTLYPLMWRSAFPAISSTSSTDQLFTAPHQLWDHLPQGRYREGLPGQKTHHRHYHAHIQVSQGKNQTKDLITKVLQTGYWGEWILLSSEWVQEQHMPGSSLVVRRFMVDVIHEPEVHSRCYSRARGPQ